MHDAAPGEVAPSAAVSADQITFILSDPFISSYLSAPSITEPGKYNGVFCILFSHNSWMHGRRAVGCRLASLFQRLVVELRTAWPPW
jgi:hypothetical protein